jgi:predicted DCC family thiol-disulfide oxidoreductase YuxK
MWAQSENGKELLKTCGLLEDYLETVIYLENGMPYYKSNAALKIAKGLSMPWPILSKVGMLVPEMIRDSIYEWIAKNRYQWFGKRDVCRVPTKDLLAGFYKNLARSE